MNHPGKLHLWVEDQRSKEGETGVGRNPKETREKDFENNKPMTLSTWSGKSKTWKEEIKGWERERQMEDGKIEDFEENSKSKVVSTKIKGS